MVKMPHSLSLCHPSATTTKGREGKKCVYIKFKGNNITDSDAKMHHGLVGLGTCSSVDIYGCVNFQLPKIGIVFPPPGLVCLCV